MPFAVKQRVVLVALAVLAVWPALHPLVVRATGLNPWKGFGWAMYCVPSPVVNIEVRFPDGAPASLGTLTEERQHRLELRTDLFAKRRQHIGPRVEPDDVARAVFEAYPDTQRVEITVREFAVDRRTAMAVERRRDTFVYPR